MWTNGKNQSWFLWVVVYKADFSPASYFLSEERESSPVLSCSSGFWPWVGSLGVGLFCYIWLHTLNTHAIARIYFFKQTRSLLFGIIQKRSYHMLKETVGDEDHRVASLWLVLHVVLHVMYPGDAADAGGNCDQGGLGRHDHSFLPNFGMCFHVMQTSPFIHVCVR